MNPLNWEELRANPDLLLERIKSGGPIELIQDGQSVAEIYPVGPLQDGLRPYGGAAGTFVVPANFDESLPNDVMAAFEGE